MISAQSGTWSVLQNPIQNTRDIDYLCIFKIITESQNWNMGLLNTSDHIPFISRCNSPIRNLYSSLKPECFLSKQNRSEIYVIIAKLRLFQYLSVWFNLDSAGLSLLTFEYRLFSGESFETSAVSYNINKTRGLRRWPSHNQFNPGSSKGGSRHTQTDWSFNGFASLTKLAQPWRLQRCN